MVAEVSGSRGSTDWQQREHCMVAEGSLVAEESLVAEGATIICCSAPQCSLCYCYHDLLQCSPIIMMECNGRHMSTSSSRGIMVSEGALVAEVSGSRGSTWYQVAEGALVSRGNTGSRGSTAWGALQQIMVAVAEGALNVSTGTSLHVGQPAWKPQ